MKVKLNRQKLEAFNNLLTWLLVAYDCTNMADKLLFEIVDVINDKLTIKLKKISRDNKVTSNVKLTNIEAKALYVWYVQLAAIVGNGQYVYEKCIVDGIVRDIEQQYV